MAGSLDPVGLLPNPSLGHCTLGEKPAAGLGLAKDTARPAMRPLLPLSFSITFLHRREGREGARKASGHPRASPEGGSTQGGQGPELQLHFLTVQALISGDCDPI